MRLNTKELYRMNEGELREGKQIQILELEIDNFDVEIPPAPEDVFTWQSDRKPLYAIRKTKAIIERILLTAGEYQNLKSQNKAVRKQAEELKSKLDKIKSYGRILSSIDYVQPAYDELVDDIDIEDEATPCIACSR